MSITITKKAEKWFQTECGITKGDSLRFYPRYGGCGDVQQGFSLGFRKETPFLVGAKVQLNDVTYFIEETDLWYFDDHDLHLTINQENELQFLYKKLA